MTVKYRMGLMVVGQSHAQAIGPAAFQANAFQYTGFQLAEQISYDLTVPAGSLSLSGVIPVASFGTNLSPPTVSLTLTGIIPNASLGTNLIPASGSLALTGIAPTSSFDFQFIPASGSLAFTGVTAETSYGTLLIPDTANLTFTGFVPTSVYDTLLIPDSTALAFTGIVPQTVLDTIFIPDNGSLSLTGEIPLAIFGTMLSPDSGALSLTGAIPSAVVGGGVVDTLLTPDAGSLTVTGKVPASTVVSLSPTFQPGTYALSLTGGAPSFFPLIVMVVPTGTLRLRGRWPSVHTTPKPRPRSLYVIDPFGMKLHDWADVTVMNLEPHTHIARLDDDDWQRWGAWLATAPNLSQNHLPSPYQYDDWRMWAKALNNTLSPAGY